MSMDSEDSKIRAVDHVNDDRQSAGGWLVTTTIFGVSQKPQIYIFCFVFFLHSSITKTMCTCVLVSCMLNVLSMYLSYFRCTSRINWLFLQWSGRVTCHSFSPRRRVGSGRVRLLVGGVQSKKWPVSISAAHNNYCNHFTIAVVASVDRVVEPEANDR